MGNRDDPPRKSMVVRVIAPVVVLAIATVALAVWGFSRIPDRDVTGSDTIYDTLQLFYVEWQTPETGTPWQLDIARFLAPLVILYAVLVAAFAVARDQVQRLRTRLFARGHVLIVGTGNQGARLARSLRASRKVVALELDAASGSANGLRETGVPVLIGDARDPAMLRSARADRAAHVALFTGDDSTNLEVLAALRMVIDSDRPVPVHTAIDTPALWAELHRLPMQSARAPRRVEFLSIPDRVAQLLIESAVGGDTVSGDRQTLVIRGVGPTVARLTVHLLRSPMVGEGAEIVLEGDDADENLRILEATDRWVFDRARVRGADRAEDPAAATVAFVCGLGGGRALEAAMMLVHRVEGRAPVHVAMPDSGAELALREAGIDLSRLKLVPTGDVLFGEQLLQEAAFERIARGMHADYVIQQRARGDTPEQNDALRPWEELDEKYRQSNRRFADGVGNVLAKIGAELVPLTGRPVGELPVSPEVFEQLAINEHDRWCRDQLRDGWHATDGEKDQDRKLHPMLKPWEDLPESERKKDRDAIRALPKLFASVGYELVVAPSPPEGGPLTDQTERGLRGESPKGR